MSVVGFRHLVQLGPDHVRAALRYCARRPHHATYAAGWLTDGGLLESPRTPRAWMFADRAPDGEVRGLVYVSDTGIVLPIVDDYASLDGLVEIGRRTPTAIRVIVGERDVVAHLWRRLSKLGFSARISRDQLGYIVEAADFTATSDVTLTRASDAHLDDIVEASAAMAREEARDDPQSRNPRLFRARIHERLGRGRDFVIEHERHISFKCNVSALSPIGGQIEGIYTLPAYRGAGVGHSGTCAVTAWVLARAERAFLLVNDDNTVARGLYEKLGYRAVLDSRTIFVA